MKNKIIPWLTALGILFVIFLTIYGVSQQVQRNDADYPQIQIAEDAAAMLNSGAKPNSIASGAINMNSSLAPFIIVYTKSGQVISGSGYLNNKIPQAPIGILTNSNDKDYYRVTWQPQSNVRIAAVTVSANHYYVLSGRSLKIIEKNENHTFQIAFAGGLLSVAILFVGFVIYNPSKKS